VPPQARFRFFGPILLSYRRRQHCDSPRLRLRGSGQQELSVSSEIANVGQPERAARGREAPPPQSRQPPVDLTRGALPEIFERQVTPLRLFLTSIVAVGVTEFFVCLALNLSGVRRIGSPYAEALLTVISLVVLIIPVLYAGLYRPMIKHTARQVQLENALRELATVDELTAVLNRRGFYAVAEDHLRLARRLRKGLYCLFMDLNGFKRINDTLGHKVGDQALIETALLLKLTFRESDLIARVGGDEFIVLGIETGSSAANRMAVRLQEKLEAANAQPGRKYRLSLCIGVAHFEPGQEGSIADLVARADGQMYMEKQALRNAQSAAT
jgi:diguanylate cyclase (GGDEF)-like protein